MSKASHLRLIGCMVLGVLEETVWSWMRRGEKPHPSFK